MEKLSDEKLQLFAGMEPIDPVDETVKSMAADLLSTRAKLIEWESRGNELHKLIVSETGCFSVEILINEYKATRASLSALQEQVRWVPVGERLPEAKQEVLAIVKYNKIHTEKVCYIPPRTVLSEDFLSDECDCESVEDYDAENDCYWVKEGWWEASFEADTNWKLSGEVTHWMPLPLPPLPVEEK